LSTLQEQQGPIDRLIVSELIAATPEWWNSATYEIERFVEAGNIEKYRQVITSPEKHRDIVSPTEELYNAVIQLADIFKERGEVWRKATYKIELLPDNSWKYNVKFDY
jgi:hypothetical protein